MALHPRKTTAFRQPSDTDDHGRTPARPYRVAGADTNACSNPASWSPTRPGEGRMPDFEAKTVLQGNPVQAGGLYPISRMSYGTFEPAWERRPTGCALQFITRSFASPRSRGSRDRRRAHRWPSVRRASASFATIGCSIRPADPQTMRFILPRRPRTLLHALSAGQGYRPDAPDPTDHSGTNRADPTALGPVLQGLRQECETRCRPSGVSWTTACCQTLSPCWRACQRRSAELESGTASGRARLHRNRKAAETRMSAPHPRQTKP